MTLRQRVVAVHVLRAVSDQARLSTMDGPR
ncbi:hypothetical protein COMA1_10847 [Candidatus Nitrospira nitrosa]|uniref:Uncharacterized protein n=1 Tax=Candidatus Nitrospira nitrosa TaxID=1742972 RepID=A0A0S4L7W5_9BACT|nr:hypothetical protein COMA1_10847 [Candidatus Nitrospira nitrosa]